MCKFHFNFYFVYESDDEAYEIAAFVACNFVRESRLKVFSSGNWRCKGFQHQKSLIYYFKEVFLKLFRTYVQIMKYGYVEGMPTRYSVKQKVASLSHNIYPFLNFL